MKKILNSFFIGLLFLSITSCHDKLLEETSYDQLADSSFPKSFEDLELVANGVYARFGYYHLRYGAYEYMCTLNSVEGCFKERGGGNDRGGGDHYSWHENPDFRDSFQRNFYWAWETIQQANDVLSALEQSDLDADETLLNRVEGEAKTIRAWVYFDLVRFYGAMPIVEKKPKLNNEELLIERPGDVRVTYDFIIEELQDAITLLPTKTDYINNAGLGEKGRLTKAAAQMILAKVYLTMNGYPLNDNSMLADAKELLKEIEGGGEYTLLQDYKEVFSMDNELNDEIIYAIQNNPFSFAGELYSISRMLPPHETAKYDGTIQGWLPQFGAPLEFMLKYKESDGGVRYQHNFSEQWTDASGDTTTAIDYGSAYITKFSMPEGYSNGGSFQHPVDFPLLRYADVLLMLAEVESELSGVSGASVDYLNQIRNRAGYPDYYDVGQFSSKEQLTDTIFWERNLELCYEHHGVHDLRRRGYNKLREIVTSDLWYDPDISKKNAQDFNYITSGAIPESHMLYPIPPTYLNQNPNFSQNPGY